MPAIEIDTELANAQYENQHDLELQMEQDALDDAANGVAGAYPQNDNMHSGAPGESPDNHQLDLQDNQSGTP